MVVQLYKCLLFAVEFYKQAHFPISNWGCRGRDRMVVGFTTTHAISA